MKICCTLSEMKNGFVELSIHEVFYRSDSARDIYSTSLSCSVTPRPHSIYSLPKPAFAFTFSRSVSSAASAMG